MESTMQNSPLTITEILRHATTVHGTRSVSTATGDGFRRTTYHQLGEEAAQLAGALRELGITNDQRVATFMGNNTEHLTAYLALPAMGAVLHTLNIRLFPEQLAYIANEAEDQIVMVDAALAGLLAPVLPELPAVHTVIMTGEGDPAVLDGSGKTVLRYRDLLDGRRAEFAWPDLDENAAAAMCYTSGTTGDPKGVVYSHRSTYLHSMMVCTGNALGIGARDRVLPIVPMFHANAWGLPHASLMAGADLVLPDRRMDPASLVSLIEETRPTVAGAVPTIWNDVAHHLDREGGHDISSLRLVVCGGSAVPVSLIRTFEERYGVRIMQAWGMTETSPLGTVAWPPPDATGEQQWAYRGTLGQPVCGVEARIVDDDGNEVPSGGESVGELEVRGPWITASYYRGRDATKFDRGWLHTGDVGRMDERQFITLTDRVKDVIKSGGEWISSVDLENELVAHPDVIEAAVVGVPDQRWQERPLAAVVLRPEAQTHAVELRRFLAERVVRWWLPERWTFIDHIPRTGVGKYDKKLIRERYANGAYDIVKACD